MQVFSYIAEAKRCLFARAAVVLSLSILVLTAASPARANYASLIMDAGTGQVLHEVNGDLSRYPASLTKMMTLYMLFEALDDGLLTLEDRFPISAHAASQPPTKIGLKPGQSISVENAILALITKSANDIAAAIAEGLGGSESQFAWMMTAKAHEIGMSRTQFMNASGLPNPSQVTTARDMGILALALLHDFPRYYPYFATERFQFGGSVHPNHNRMLGVYEGMDGIKTGYTHASGFNLVASAQRDGRRLIGVVLGARSPANRSLIMGSLLDQAFAGQDVIEVYNTVPTSPLVARGERQPEFAAVGASSLAAMSRRPQQTSRAVAARAPVRAEKRAVAAKSSRTALRADRTRANRSVAARSPSSRSAARSAARAQSAKTVVTAAAKPGAKTSAAARPAAAKEAGRPAAAAPAKKGKPEVAVDSKTKAKARRSQATNERSGRDKRV